MKKSYNEPLFELHSFCFEEILTKKMLPSDPEIGQGDGDPGAGGDPFG